MAHLKLVDLEAWITKVTELVEKIVCAGILLTYHSGENSLTVGADPAHHILMFFGLTPVSFQSTYIVGILNYVL